MARTKHGGDLGSHERNTLDSKSFAFAKQRKEPLVDADHVRNAVARFDQVEGQGVRFLGWSCLLRRRNA